MYPDSKNGINPKRTGSLFTPKEVMRSQPISVLIFNTEQGKTIKEVQ